MGGGRRAVRFPPLCFFALYAKTVGNPYLKIPDFSQLFIVDAPMKKKIKKFSFTPAQSTFGTPSTNIFLIFLLYKL